jgi:hypothetical protein
MRRTTHHLVSFGFGLAGVALALGGSAGAVGAGQSTASVPSITFPLTTVAYGESGTIHEITSGAVPADLVGQSCSVTATADNNGSVHPQSDLIVSSGSGQVTVRDVEATAGATTTAAGTLTLGTMVTVSVQLGPDGVFSGGGTVDLVCAQAAPVTTPTTEAVTPPAAVEAAVVASPGFTG